MKILVALSGGVDSSVAAALLLDQGHDVITATLKTFCYAELEEGPRSCCGLEGVEAARTVARHLGVPHFVYDVSERFKTAVIQNFVTEYARGRTPNPCVICNATVKIPDLLEKGKSIGCDHLATGHYAASSSTHPGGALFRGKDRNKDQSYFLWEIPKSILPQVHFPVGGLTKGEVRDLAKKRGFSNAEKQESQEICFIPKGDYVEFLRQMLPTDHPGFSPGNIVDSGGKVLGNHSGFLGYTIGQRKGLGGGHGQRLFVISINASTREVLVGKESELAGTDLFVEPPHLLVPSESFETPVEIQIRHRAKPIVGNLVRATEQHWHFRLEQEARAITPGQSAVFYEKDRVLGGGRIIPKPR